MTGGQASDDPVAGRVSSGIVGLDNILGGGFPANRLHLVKGAPGTGKTTLALHFLLEGARQGETVLYVTLSETIEELREVAASHGWDLDGISLQEFAPSVKSLRPEEQYTILQPAEVELGETTWAVLAEVERTKPTRVVFDSLAELRLLARDQLRYRRQILGLKQFFTGQHCTVLLLDSHDDPSGGLDSIAHSVIQLEQLLLEYGGERRRLRVMKLRGGSYRGGYHDLVIETGGIVAYPRLAAQESTRFFTPELVPSDVPELESLLGGGMHRGTSVLLIGPAGVGKSVLATHYAVAAARRGERSAIYIFDESTRTFVARSEGLQLGLRDWLEQGQISLQQLDPARLSPGQFDHLVMQAVEGDGARVVIIDSLNGYLNAMAEERLVLVQLHELLTYLGQHGVLTLITMAQHGFVGERPESPIDVSYLADTVMLLRYFEALGEVRQAISVMKKRSGPHERTIRELRLGPGVNVGPPLRQFQGVLAGSPTYFGSENSLLARDGQSGGTDVHA